MNCPLCANNRAWFGTFEDQGDTVIWHDRYPADPDRILEIALSHPALRNRTVRIYSHPDRRYLGGQVME